MPTPISLAIGAMAVAVSASIIPLAFVRQGDKQRFALGILLAASGMVSILSGYFALLLEKPETIQFAAGLPWSPMRFQIDALSGFFMLVAGSLLFPVGIYSVGYLKDGLRYLIVFLPLFVIGMQGVVLADDAYTFMLFWELMSVSSYFLVVFEHREAANRNAGFLYLLMAHLAGLLILGAFAVLYRAGGSFNFDAMRSAEIAPLWATIAFLLAGFGFGMKAGIVPLHVWLPEAHPAAPSNVSALMSGVMLKAAIFGFIKVVWDIIGVESFQWWWGALVLAAGSSSALFGVLMALQQHDLKRLLAYHSVENIGIILIGLGLAMIFAFYDHPMMAALGLVAGLYHTINHTLFKGLLFMGAGSLLHSTGTRDMEKMGGLIHRLPATSIFFLVACISISALPPFNGFISEWLTFQTALMAPKLEGTLLAAMIPFSASILALAGALAATCFVKVYGIVFLGSPRSNNALNAHEVDGWMKTGMAIPALFCLLLGVLPTFFVSLIDNVPQLLLKISLAKSMEVHGWLWLTPISGERASYSAPVVLVGMLVISFVIYILVRPKGIRIERKAAWSCGYPKLNSRMQYTATSFSQPLRRIFSGIYKPTVQKDVQYNSDKLTIKSVRYEAHVEDMVFKHLYRPIAKITDLIAEWTASQHQKGLHSYLIHIFVTMLLLLAWVTLWK